MRLNVVTITGDVQCSTAQPDLMRSWQPVRHPVYSIDRQLKMYSICTISMKVLLLLMDMYDGDFLATVMILSRNPGSSVGCYSPFMLAYTNSTIIWFGN